MFDKRISPDISSRPWQRHWHSSLNGDQQDWWRRNEDEPDRFPRQRFFFLRFFSWDNLEDSHIVPLAALNQRLDVLALRHCQGPSQKTLF